MKQLSLLVLYAALRNAAADAGDCTVADFEEMQRADAASEDPSLSQACACSRPLSVSRLVAVLRACNRCRVWLSVARARATAGATCLAAGLTQTSTDEERAAALYACLPAPAAGQCSHADIGASSDEDEGTVASAACMACMAVGAASIDGEPTDEQGAELLLACAPAASVGDCTAADFETVSTAEPSLSTACTSLRLSRPTTQHTPI